MPDRSKYYFYDSYIWDLKDVDEVLRRMSDHAPVPFEVTRGRATK